MGLKKIISQKDEIDIINSIKKFEKITSGEIKLHIQYNTWINPYKLAFKWFKKLVDGKTKEKNGVLIFIAFRKHKIVIYAEENINKCVENDFWNSCYEIMRNGFRNNKYAESIIEVIEIIGLKLSIYFPYNELIDKNEIEDSISKK